MSMRKTIGSSGSYRISVWLFQGNTPCHLETLNISIHWYLTPVIICGNTFVAYSNLKLSDMLALCPRANLGMI